MPTLGGSTSSTHFAEPLEQADMCLCGSGLCMGAASYGTKLVTRAGDASLTARLTCNF